MKNTSPESAFDDAPAPWTPDGRRMQRSGTGASTVILVLLLLLGELDLWRFVLLGTCWGVQVSSFFIEQWYSKRLSTWTLARITLTTQIASVMVTGGLQSPVVLAIPATVFYMGLALERRFHIHLFVLYTLPIAALIAMSFGHWDRWMELDVLATMAQNNPLERLVFGSGIILISLLAIINGSLMRQTYQQRLEEIRMWQHHVLEAREQRTHDLHKIAGALAHELKNPLTAIQGLSSFMHDRAEPGSEDAKRLDVVVGETRRMRDTLNRLLNVARPTHDLLFEPIAMVELLHEIIQLHQPLATQKGVVITTDLTQDVICVCDPRKLKQIVVNLLQNALEAAPAQTTVHVTLMCGELRSSESACRIWIDDEGPGLSPNIREDPFAPGVTTKATGTGLGLAIVRALTAQHRGVVTLQERPDQTPGCRAALTLPIHQPAPNIEEDPHGS
ncbi:MAG: HAMP domain-containing sensor histidine kinase [Myxococcota bacterium]